MGQNLRHKNHTPLHLPLIYLRFPVVEFGKPSPNPGNAATSASEYRASQMDPFVEPDK